MQSHALSFYVDIAYAWILWMFASYCTKGMPSSHFEPVKANVIGLVGHGFGHLYAGLRQNYNGELTLYAMNKDTPAQLAITYTIIFFFWWSLTIATKKHLGAMNHLIMVLAIMNFEFFIVPDKIAFCYVQCLIVGS